jgi:transcriptional regulator with XRE-family HTH domain
LIETIRSFPQVGQKQRTAPFRGGFFIRNVPALARRMGISQSLMAQYISGKKNASKARMDLILDTIHAVGQELAAV